MDRKRVEGIKRHAMALPWTAVTQQLIEVCDYALELEAKLKEAQDEAAPPSA